MMDLAALTTGIQFNLIRRLATEMLAYRVDAAYHLVELAVRLHYIDLGDAKEIRVHLDAMQVG